MAEVDFEYPTSFCVWMQRMGYSIKDAARELDIYPPLAREYRCGVAGRSGQPAEPHSFILKRMAALHAGVRRPPSLYRGQRRARLEDISNEPPWPKEFEEACKKGPPRAPIASLSLTRTASTALSRELPWEKARIARKEEYCDTPFSRWLATVGFTAEKAKEVFRATERVINSYRTGSAPLPPHWRLAVSAIYVGLAPARPSDDPKRKMMAFRFADAAEAKGLPMWPISRDPETEKTLKRYREEYQAERSAISNVSRPGASAEEKKVSRPEGLAGAARLYEDDIDPGEEGLIVEEPMKVQPVGHGQEGDAPKKPGKFDPKFKSTYSDVRMRKIAASFLDAAADQTDREDRRNFISSVLRVLGAGCVTEIAPRDRRNIVAKLVDRHAGRKKSIEAQPVHRSELHVPFAIFVCSCGRVLQLPVQEIDPSLLKDLSRE